MRTIDASFWTNTIPQGDGEQRSLLLPIEKDGVVWEMEVRSAEPVIVNLINKDGETVFLDSGQHVEFVGRVKGFSAFEILASSPFSHRSNVKGRWFETVDPTRLTVEIDESAKKPIADLVRAELQKYLARRSMDSELGSDVSVEELLDDLENGDLEFETEEDPFGLGYAELHPEVDDPVEPATKPREDGSLPLSGSHPDQPLKAGSVAGKTGSDTLQSGTAPSSST